MNNVYLNLGSNIQAELNLPKALQALKEYGEVAAVSRAWESESVGAEAPNYLNACTLFLTELAPDELKEKIIHPIEALLGRVRAKDKYAPRIIDIDLVLFNETPLGIQYWSYAFFIVPLAELIPDFIHPTQKEKLAQISVQMQSAIWIVPRLDVLLA